MRGWMVGKEKEREWRKEWDFGEMEGGEGRKYYMWWRLAGNGGEWWWWKGERRK